jgi:pimeloyl-ACP methyl ester carboxylesterase
LNNIRRGDGPPLLLIHSLGGTLAQWSPVIDMLAAEREVVAVDMPGFGDSPPLPDGIEPTAANLASAVLDFYESLGLDRPGIAGISLGAWVAIECGRQGGARAIVALSPAGFWREPLAPSRNGAHRAARALGPVTPLLMRVPAIRRSALAGNVHDPTRLRPAEATALVRGYGRASAYAEANRHMRASVVGDLSDLKVPLTIAWADHDRVVRNRPLKEGILPRRVKQLTLPNCGHVPTWDDPELVTRVILEGTEGKGGLK